MHWPNFRRQNASLKEKSSENAFIFWFLFYYSFGYFCSAYWAAQERTDKWKFIARFWFNAKTMANFFFLLYNKCRILGSMQCNPQWILCVAFVAPHTFGKRCRCCVVWLITVKTSNSLVCESKFVQWNKGYTSLSNAIAMRTKRIEWKAEKNVSFKTYENDRWTNQLFVSQTAGVRLWKLCRIFFLLCSCLLSLFCSQFRILLKM